MDSTRGENPITDTNAREYRPRPHKSSRFATRRSVGSINDWQEAELKVAEDTAPSVNLSRKQKRAMPQLKHDISYGQYLHTPKSQRAIFTSQATKHRNKILVRTLIVIALAAVVYLVAKYIL